MKAIMPSALPDVLSYRKRRGQDRWDEMWDGVLHMPPMPNIEHQDLEGDLQAYLREFWPTPALPHKSQTAPLTPALSPRNARGEGGRRPGEGCLGNCEAKPATPINAKVWHHVNLASIGGWPNDYRIPDLALLTRDRLQINRGDYLEGAPTVVTEIMSPGDETREKVPFYAELGVPELWVIDRDTKEPEIFVLRDRRYRKQKQVASDWTRSRRLASRCVAWPAKSCLSGLLVGTRLAANCPRIKT